MAIIKAMAIIKKQKRASEGGAGASDDRATKKRALDNKMLDGSKLVAATLDRNTDLPAEAVASLREAAPHCLSTFKDKRHEYQESIVVMIGKALDGIEAGLKTSVQAAEVKLDGIDKAKLEVALFQQVRNVANAKAAVAHREADRTKAQFNARKTSENAAHEAKFQLQSVAVYDSVFERKKTLDATVASAEAIKTSVPDKNTLAKFVASLKSIDVDRSLIPTLSNVLVNEGERGEFDDMTLKNMDDEIAAKVADFTAEITSLEAEKHDRAAALSLAQQAQITAAETVESAHTTLTKAHEALDESKAALATTEDSIKNFSKALKSAQDELAAAQRQLAEFQKGPLGTFNDLKERTTPGSEPAEQPQAEVAA